MATILPPMTTVQACGDDHPEKQRGEIFLGNGNQAGFAQLSYRTKRMGRRAYGADGQHLPQYIPIFCDEAEYRETRQEGTSN